MVATKPRRLSYRNPQSSIDLFRFSRLQRHVCGPLQHLPFWETAEIHRLESSYSAKCSDSPRWPISNWAHRGKQIKASINARRYFQLFYNRIGFYQWTTRTLSQPITNYTYFQRSLCRTRRPSESHYLRVQSTFSTERMDLNIPRKRFFSYTDFPPRPINTATWFRFSLPNTMLSVRTCPDSASQKYLAPLHTLLMH